MKIHFRKHSEQIDLPIVDPASEIEERLTQFGVSARAAAQLAADKDEGFLERQIQILKHYIEPENLGRPGAWLATACRGSGFKTPPGFVDPDQIKAMEAAQRARAPKNGSGGGQS